MVRSRMNRMCFPTSAELGFPDVKPIFHSEIDLPNSTDSEKRTQNQLLKPTSCVKRRKQGDKKWFYNSASLTERDQLCFSPLSATAGSLGTLIRGAPSYCQSLLSAACSVDGSAGYGTRWQSGSGGRETPWQSQRVSLQRVSRERLRKLSISNWTVVFDRPGAARALTTRGGSS